MILCGLKQCVFDKKVVFLSHTHTKPRKPTLILSNVVPCHRGAQSITTLRYHIMRLLRNIAAYTLLSIMLASCGSTKEVVYLQDLEPVEGQVIANLNAVRVQPGDEISIIVTAKDPQLAQLYNLVTPPNRLNNSKIFTSMGDVQPYLVNSEGNIDFPQLGEIHVAGLTREEIAKDIKKRLASADQLKDAVVTVNFVNLHFAVVGEVKSPGTYEISSDRVTIIDALSMAGDLTIFGKRNNISVVREQDGKRYVYQIDLRSKDLFDSPAYYLQQNDVVYVQPNKTRAGQASVNENQWKNVGIWVSLASVLTSICVLIFK